MASVIKLRDGSIHTVFDRQDVMRLIDEHLGDEVLDWLEPETDHLEYIQYLETENADLKVCHKRVMESIYELTRQLPAIIQEHEIDRQRLSSLAGKICDSVRRELR